MFEIKICSRCKEKVFGCNDGSNGMGEKNCDTCATANKETCSRRKEVWDWSEKRNKKFSGICDSCIEENF